jgi:hypothetical protein
LNQEQTERLKEIIKLADELGWIASWATQCPHLKLSYPLMQLSEVEKCMIAFVDDFELQRMRKWVKEIEVVHDGSQTLMNGTTVNKANP